MDQHLSCYFTDQFISSIPSNSLPNRSLETYFIHDHFNPCFLQNGDKRSSPDVMFKAERYTKDITRALLKLLLHAETRLCCRIYVFFRRLEITGRLSDDCNGSSIPNSFIWAHGILQLTLQVPRAWLSAFHPNQLLTRERKTFLNVVLALV